VWPEFANMTSAETHKSTVDESLCLKESQARPAWQDVLSEIREVRARLAARREEQPLPSPEEVIREMREERDVCFPVRET
jgi:hypothetical protein